jgi:hypothetical protein
MKQTLTSLANPHWVNAEHTLIDCEITTDKYDDEVLPFTANASDPEEFGRLIFQALVNGEFGPIAAYTPPTKEELGATARGERNALLASSDWTQAGDVPQATKDRWIPYRQALREVPDQVGFPENILWPTAP